VTPTLYWRCAGGRVFEVEPLAANRLDHHTLQRLQAIDLQIDFYRRHLAELARQPGDVLAIVAPLREQWQHELGTLVDERGALLGETLRLWGGWVAPGEDLSCRLTLRLRNSATVASVSCRVEFPPDLLEFVGARRGADSADEPPATADVGHGTLRVLVPDGSRGAPWPAGEYELGVLRFRAPAGTAAGIADLRVTDVRVVRTAPPGALGLVAPPRVVAALDGVVFVGDASPVAGGRGHAPPA
jgi:hypothetical protein